MPLISLVGEEKTENALVKGSGSTLGTPGAHLLDGEPRLAARVEVDLVNLLGGGALPEVADDPEA